MPKRSSSRKKKVPTEVWVALIGLIGVTITAVFSSPILVAIFTSTPVPTTVSTQTLVSDDAHTSTAKPTLTSASPPAKATSTTVISTAASPGCTPSPHSELPPQSIAIVEPDDGAKSRVPLSTLEYERMSALRLASGMTIDFKRMKSFELSNKDFINHFTADVVITFLDCTTYQDVIRSESGSFLTGKTEFGRIELHILDVKRVDFQW